METENDIDQLFKRGLQHPEIPFNELDWEKMEQKLDGKGKKRVIPVWIFGATGIAAVLTVLLFWILTTPVPEGQNLSQLPVKKDLRKTEGQPSLSTKKLDDQPAVNFKTRADLGFEQSGERTAAVTPQFNLVDGPAAFVPVADQATVMLSPYKPAQNLAFNPAAGERLPVTALLKTGLPARQLMPLTDSAILAQKANALANSKDPFGRISAAEIAGSVQKNMDKNLARQHQLILSAMAAPDITAAAASKPAKISSNVGMLATYALGSRFSVTSGAIYAKKYYNSGGTNPEVAYSSNSGLAWEVKADCNVLDIPINVNYKLLAKKKLSVSINSGLSSYLMLKEKYEFITDKPGNVQDVSTLELNNKNQHLLGVANVAVSFEHQLSENLSIGVQPFAKLPLTGIGNGNVNLRSTGVSFSLNIGLFPAKKTGKMAANRYSARW